MPRVVQKTEQKRLTALGCHIFAGGFTVGVKRAGFDVLAHLEDSPYGVKSARMNWPDLDVRIGRENWRPEEFAGRVDLFYNNPPCALFSTAGPSTTRGPEAWRDDTRLGCWHRSFEVFKIVKPRVFVLESVCQAYTKGREVVDLFTRESLTMGYSVKHVLMDAKWTGLPQSRKRFFFVVYEPSLDLQLSFDYDRKLTTVGDALATVGSDCGYTHASRWQTDPACREVVEATPQGGKLRVAFDSMRPDAEVIEVNGKSRILGRPGFLGQRLNAAGQMGVFIGDVFIHPTEHRNLGTREMMALCGYPLDFKLEGSSRQWPGYLARAVMPAVGEWLASAVNSAIRRSKI